MSRQIQVRRHYTSESGFVISAISKYMLGSRSIRCNRIEHWVHLRCAGIRQAQYTDTWICHQHRESTHYSHRHNTSHPSRPWSKPLPTPHIHHPHHRNQITDTRPTLPCSHRIGKAQTYYVFRQKPAIAMHLALLFVVLVCHSLCPILLLFPFPSS